MTADPQERPEARCANCGRAETEGHDDSCPDSVMEEHPEAPERTMDLEEFVEEHNQLRARYEEAIAALRPFAREADEWDNYEDDDSLNPEIGAPDEETDTAWFTVADLRRARATLRKHGRTNG